MPDDLFQDWPEPQPENPQRDELPPALANGLKRFDAPPAGVPAEIDARLLRKARRRLTWGRRLVWRVAAVGALAAAVAVVFILPEFQPRVQPPPDAPTPPVFAEGDIDGNGRIDILDAFLLAKRLESGAAKQPEWDVDDNGRIDRRDIDAVALMAVRINGGSPS